jgi:hypothetical protein
MCVDEGKKKSEKPAHLKTKQAWMARTLLLVLKMMMIMMMELRLRVV